jgi:hypothetical protein
MSEYPLPIAAQRSRAVTRLVLRSGGPSGTETGAAPASFISNFATQNGLVAPTNQDDRATSS